MSRTFLVLSGQVVRDNKPDLRPFWKGFINIQSNLNTNDQIEIIGHTSSIKYREFILSVYRSKDFVTDDFEFNDRIRRAINYIESKLETKNS
jgi:hypothetical protein